MRHLRVDDSSNVASWGYDAASETLQIRFANGGLYEYPHVTPQILASLAGAESVGKWVARELVAKKWPFKRIEGEMPAQLLTQAEAQERLGRMRTALELIASADPSAGSANLIAAARDALETSK